jgi:hypothetical protein
MGSHHQLGCLRHPAQPGNSGDCYDNVMIEAFWGRIQIELLNRKRWNTVVKINVAVGG